MSSGPLFTGHLSPVRAQWCTPVDLGTADCGKVCRGYDGCDYVIKDAVAHPAVPHAEWFCSQLGEKVGVAAPPHKVIDLGDGSMAFGSRWQGGLLTPDDGAPWYDRVRDGEISTAEVSPTLSKIYALDLFVHNVDRHCNNFLIHKQYSGYAILALDYSRAWVRYGFPLAPPPLPDCNTVSAQRWLCGRWNTNFVDAAIVKETCEKIGNITQPEIASIIDSHPPNWLQDGVREDILLWWGSADMAARLNAITEGVENGVCL